MDGPITEIGDCCFEGCTSLEKASFSDNLKITSLGRNCFSDCSKLVDVKLPSSLTQLESSAFNSCQALQKLVLPSKIKSLGMNCFSDCSSLSDIQLSESLQTIGTFCFSSCSALKELTIPAAVEEIGMLAFSGTGIEDLYFSEGLTSLASYGFSKMSSLKKVYLPSTLENVGTGVFDNCDGITEVVCLAVTPPDYEGVNQSLPMISSYVASNATLYVPEESIKQYKDDKNWGVFNKIEPYKGATGIESPTLASASFDVNNGVVKVSGVSDGTPIAVYTLDGKLLSSSKVSNGYANLNVVSGGIILKVGKQAVKMMVK